MADVISTLFGITPRQAELQRREQDLGLGGLFAAATLNPYAAPSVQNAYLKQQQAQFALGSMGARGLGSLFGLQDPEVKKAADIESILSQTQEELGEDLSNPEVLFPALVNKLQAAGYGREATMAAMQGQKAIQDYRLSGAKLATEQAQATKYNTEAAIKQAEFDPLKNAPESVKLRAYQRQAIEAGDVQLAQDLEADIKKKQYIAEAVPDREADRIILDEFKQQFGEVDGARRYSDWKNRERERVASAGKTSIVLPQGGSSTIDVGRIEDSFKTIVGPSRENISAIRKAVVVANQAVAGSPTANEQLNSAIADLYQNGKLSNQDIERVANAGSLPQKIVNGISKLARGIDADITLQDKIDFIKALEKLYAEQNNKAVDRFERVWKTTPIGEETLKAYTEGSRYQITTPTADSFTTKSGTKVRIIQE